MVLSLFTLDASVFNAGVSTADWNAVKTAHSENGLRVIDPKEGGFAIVRYDRSKGTVTDAMGWLRSVTFNKETGRVVCVAPPKASALPREEAAWASMKDCVVQEFVDGTMMNLFWLPGESSAHVVTRSRLGADNSFYGEKSFLDMLKEALQHYSTANTAFKGDLNDLKPFSDNDITQFVSIVLQHPSNRVVTEVKTPRVTVVHAGHVDASGLVTVVENPSDWADHLTPLAPGKMTVPAESLASYEALSQYVEKQAATLGYQWQGYCLKDGTGTRYRIRNKEYSQVRGLRGNESDTVQRFCRLRGERSIKRYLKYYPEDEDVFYKLEGTLRSATRRLLDLYVNTFKFKKQEFHTLPWPFKHHVSVLHNEFKDKLKPQRKTVDIEFVIEYVNRLTVEDMSNLYKEPKPPKAKEAVAAPAVVAAVVA